MRLEFDVSSFGSILRVNRKLGFGIEFQRQNRDNSSAPSVSPTPTDVLGRFTKTILTEALKRFKNKHIFIKFKKKKNLYIRLFSCLLANRLIAALSNCNGILSLHRTFALQLAFPELILQFLFLYFVNVCSAFGVLAALQHQMCDDQMQYEECEGTLITKRR